MSRGNTTSSQHFDPVHEYNCAVQNWVSVVDAAWAAAPPSSVAKPRRRLQAILYGTYAACVLQGIASMCRQKWTGSRLWKYLPGGAPTRATVEWG